MTILGKRDNLKKHAAEAFTLIELLVVVAIISILASLLLPVIDSAMDKAYEAECMSNLKQIGQALQMYVQEVGIMPPVNPRFTEWENHYLQIDYYYPTYITQMDVFACLGNKPYLDAFTAIEQPTYWTNSDLYGKKFGAFPNAEEVVLAWDVYWFGGGNVPPHRDGVNVVFLDGHAYWRYTTEEITNFPKTISQ